MSISLKANAAGTQGEILLNGTPDLTLYQEGVPAADYTGGSIRVQYLGDAFA